MTRPGGSFRFGKIDVRRAGLSDDWLHKLRDCAYSELHPDDYYREYGGDSQNDPIGFLVHSACKQFIGD